MAEIDRLKEIVETFRSEKAVELFHLSYGFLQPYFLDSYILWIKKACGLKFLKH